MAIDPMFHENLAWLYCVMVLFQMAHNIVPNHLGCHSDLSPLCQQFLLGYIHVPTPHDQ